MSDTATTEALEAVRSLLAETRTQLERSKILVTGDAIFEVGYRACSNALDAWALNESLAPS